MGLNNQQAEILSSKLDKLNEFFDITTSTIDEIKKEVDAVEEPEIDIIDTNDDSIITISILKQDFNFIRSTLLETVKNGRLVIDKISLEIDVGEGSSASIISAYAELVGTVNNSLKLLSSTYKDIVDINNKINDKKKEKSGTVQGDVNITNNNIISASVNDILKAMNKDK